MLRSWITFIRRDPSFGPPIRRLTSIEISTALRPFYFSVHPDLFGKYPDQRVMNENSLKQLSSIIQSLQANKFVKPTMLKFFIRSKKEKESTLQLVEIYIEVKTVRDAVLKVLTSCGLTTDYVDKIPIETKTSESARIKHDRSKFYENDFTSWQVILKRKIEEERNLYNLHKWLLKNYDLAVDNYKKSLPLRNEVARLRQEIKNQWGFLNIKWDCGWNETHLRGCLVSFKALAEQHPEAVRILKGRILVFAPFTGVSLDGHIMLNSGEVRHNWLDLIKNVHTYDATLLRIPAFERSVSQVLRNIKIGRRKFMPKILAGEYERNLQQVTTSLSDYLGTRKYPDTWPTSLSDFELVVETEAGPLMVSPTGQFIVPSSIPGVLLVSFITKHLTEAEIKSKCYMSDKFTEKTLHKNCVDTFGLIDLRKDDNVTPDLMIQCCEKLLIHKNKLSPLLIGLHLNITTYYSVLTDGVVCIPWNFEI